MSEKIPDHEQMEAAELAWRKWHEDLQEDEVPWMPIAWKKAWREAVKWMEAKGEK